MAPVRAAGSVVVALCIGAILSSFLRKRSKSSSSRTPNVPNSRNGLVAAIGNTPLIRINSLSDATGCEILGKAEFLNPGGSVKDRVAVKIIEEALESRSLAPGGVVTEGSAGSTAISLATVAPAYGCKCHVVIPDDVAIEKSQILEALDQFENLANFRAHYEGTGPEIWEQVGGNLDAFVAAAGTGGTVAGISRFLKEKDSNIKCFLIDPPGSGLFNKVTRGVMYTREEAEGQRLKNPFDTITEGIGINRLTENFKMSELDGAFRGTDKEAVEMSRYLLKNDGLFLGSSSAMNCVGAVRLAQALGPGHTIITILCDSGMRHLTKFYNAQYLSQYGLTPSAAGLELLGLD
ncbi:Pyridoxal-5'-phosphate-dependent enzyme family protein [Abeliophyllum distichum]|uniref:cysteine synthase n=1 Tax=Abeliophyllum distichum TaxID=126358 RepID=A0ABD1UFQ3_9LAMI